MGARVLPKLALAFCVRVSYRSSGNSAVINFRALKGRRGLLNGVKVFGPLEIQEIELLTRKFYRGF